MLLEIKDILSFCKSKKSRHSCLCSSIQKEKKHYSTWDTSQCPLWKVFLLKQVLTYCSSHISCLVIIHFQDTLFQLLRNFFEKENWKQKKPIFLVLIEIFHFISPICSSVSACKSFVTSHQLIVEKFSLYTRGICKGKEVYIQRKLKFFTKKRHLNSPEKVYYLFKLYLVRKLIDFWNILRKIFVQREPMYLSKPRDPTKSHSKEKVLIFKA